MEFWNDKTNNAVLIVVAVMVAFFLLGKPVMMDDGFQYQGFTEALARGHLDFRSFYGFQGLSFFAVPVYWLTRSPISIIITSMIFSLLSIPLAYAIGKRFGSGILGLVIFLLTPYPYVTMMRGFQEAALLFFILLIIYGALEKKNWTGLAWGIGGIVKPFTFVLFPLFFRKGMKKIEIWCLMLGIFIVGAYAVANYVQTGHFVTLAATGAYQGPFDPNNVPSLGKSFTLDWKTWARVPANLFVATRKIMVSPLLIMLGMIAIRKKFILPVILNILLVGAITYAFPKYLLPATTLLSFSAIPLLVRFPIMVPLILIDSISVFMPIYAFFGHNFWNPIAFYLPFALALALYVYTYYHPDAQRV